jgi:hypothetical protein
MRILNVLREIRSVLPMDRWHQKDSTIWRPLNLTGKSWHTGMFVVCTLCYVMFWGPTSKAIVRTPFHSYCCWSCFGHVCLVDMRNVKGPFANTWPEKVFVLPATGKKNNASKTVA